MLKDSPRQTIDISVGGDVSIYASINPSMSLDESSEAFCPGEAAKERVQLFNQSWGKRGGGSIRHSSSSSVLHSDTLNNLNKYDDDDFHYGKVVGKGSFSTAQSVYLRSSNRNLRRGGHKEESGQAYALKKLQPRVYTEKTLLKTAVSDLALEAAILSKLKHENIITLYGIKGGDMIQSLKYGSFFLVLDLLVETLDIRMRKWQAQRKPLRSKVRSEGVRKRIQDVALGLAKGMEYLHSKHIIFRDLKPANIGFDEFECVKIFDFGLSREIDPETSSSEQSTFQPRLMTGGAGTPRYMAPEVAKMDHSYGFPADVYSFTMLLYQIVTMQTPFGKISSPIEFAAKVIKGTSRPPLRNVDSREIKALLQAGWSIQPEQRPTFACIHQSLNDILRKMNEPNIDSSAKKDKRKRLRHTQSDSELLKTGLLRHVSTFRRPASSSGVMSSALPEDDSDPHSSESQKKKPGATTLQSPSRRMFIWRFSSLNLRSMKEPSEDETRGLSSIVQEAQRIMSQSLSKQVKSEKKEEMQRRMKFLLRKDAGGDGRY